MLISKHIKNKVNPIEALVTQLQMTEHQSGHSRSNTKHHVTKDLDVYQKDIDVMTRDTVTNKVMRLLNLIKFCNVLKWTILSTSLPQSRSLHHRLTSARYLPYRAIAIAAVPLGCAGFQSPSVLLSRFNGSLSLAPNCCNHLWNDWIKRKRASLMRNSSVRGSKLSIKADFKNF